MAQLTGKGRFAENQLWECTNTELNITSKIHGPLAEILAQYPEHKLRFLGIEPVEYILTHKNCGTRFVPQKTKRLRAREKFADKYKFQDLMMGCCPNPECVKVDVFAWVGVDYFMRPVMYHPIAYNNHRFWIDRQDKDLVKQEKILIDPDKHSPQRQATVTGCVYDRQSGKYRYKDVISVE